MRIVLAELRHKLRTSFCPEWTYRGKIEMAVGCGDWFSLALEYFPRAVGSTPYIKSLFHTHPFQKMELLTNLVQRAFNRLRYLLLHRIYSVESPT